MSTNPTTAARIETLIAQHTTAAQAHEAAARAHRQDYGYSHPAQYSWHQSTQANRATLLADPTGIASGWEEADAIDPTDTQHADAALLHDAAARAHWAAAQELRATQPDGPATESDEDATRSATVDAAYSALASLQEIHEGDHDIEAMLAAIEAALALLGD